MRAVLVRFLTAALSMLLLLGLVEIGLRLAGPGPLSSGRRAMLRTSSNPELPYELVPGFRSQRAENPIAINVHGFRGRGVSLEKPPGTTRIVVIGDSISFAGPLREEERFTELLEQRLREQGREVEVLNLGVGGYDTPNEVVFLEQVGLAFDPDLVIVAFCINDLGMHSVNLRWLRLLERYGWAMDRLQLVRFLVQRLDRASLGRQFVELNSDEVFRREHVGRIVRVDGDAQLRRAVRDIEARLAGTEAPPPFLAWYTSEDKIGRLRFAFERLQRRAGEAGFEVLVLIVPYLDEGSFTAAYGRAYDVVGHEAGRVDFRVLDLREAFRRAGPASLREGALHPNALGHRLMAAELAAALPAAATPR